MSGPPSSSPGPLTSQAAFCRAHWSLAEAAYQRGLVQGMLNHVVVLVDLSDPASRHLAESFGIRRNDIRQKLLKARARGTSPVLAFPATTDQATDVLATLAPYAAEGLQDHRAGEEFHVVVVAAGSACIASVRSAGHFN